MKKWLYGVAVLTISIMLTGCGHEHTWIEATCTQPKICSECGETEGEALEHTWIEVTCAEPKNCRKCGAIEGEALEHILSEANYQQASFCEVCGQTVGEPLQADYEAWEIDIAELDTIYDMEFPCNQDASKSTLAKVIFSDYRTFASDDTHESQDNYEWKSVEITAVFGDDNTFDYGYDISHFFDDYYHYFDDYFSDSDTKFTVNYNGKEYSECKFLFDGDLEETEGKFDWKNTVTSTFKIEVLVPTGYDGFVWGLYNYMKWDVEDMQNANPDDYICFRFE